jgi:hypothetical protein
MQIQELSCCPICNSTSSRLGLAKKSNNKKYNSKYKKNQIESELDSAKLPSLSNLEELKEVEATTSANSEETKPKENTAHGFNLILSDQQIAMLKSIRTRNHTSINMTTGIYNSNLFKQNKLQLAPKNLSRFSR